MADQKPNILIVWGDDVGFWNISYWNNGMMGYRTPNIDRIGNEGLAFSDAYGEQSCTAGRAAFITGQLPLRTGLTKVGIPGAREGLQPEDPTIAELLKPHGYLCGQFGKNHLGDLDEFLPTAHGFDEFFGNLYHLNAEEEPEHRDYPKDPRYKERFGPRGVIHSKALPDGGQEIEDTGPLTRKRMETIDYEVTDKTLDFMDRAQEEGKPFFIWWNSTRMHYKTHVRPEKIGISGQDETGDAMVEHDEQVGVLLDKLDELGIADNTIVMYSSDNGAPFHHWPDAAITPFRSEKNTNWEGSVRVPLYVRWPGRIPAGEVRNGIISHQDWLSTIMAAVGEPDINDQLRDGKTVGDMTYKVYIDGYDQLPYLTGETDECPRSEFFYIGDGGEVLALRYGDWKWVFMEQRSRQMQLWAEPFVPLRLPKFFHLRRDPFERADTDSNLYWEWMSEHAFLGAGAQAFVLEKAKTFLEFPPRQKPGSFNLDNVADQLAKSADSGLQ